MRQASQVALRALASATCASVLSTWVVSLAGRKATGSAASATNATSHWLWGERARRVHRVDVRHTVAGYAIHHASSFFWALFYEAWRERRPRSRAWPPALAVSAAAYLVDYHVVPRRLTPGFERHLGGPAMAATYAAFALGLTLAAALRSRVRAPGPHRPAAASNAGARRQARAP
ncbi:hypothetical protein EDC50_2167 [Vulcaniibacterium tengchongense]|uniref:Uncharacterized protein n=1 Tax=Vulcaniibacterium tengchongense TaxID=1273429 RepID=A0A3N4V6F4_9GAMM|nr:hypothetical protein EDC50_2167 [Vulcaniibacterium tengchongense]